MRAPEMTDLTEMGYRLLTGASVPVSLMSYDRISAALAAAQRHREYYEVDVRALADSVCDRRCWNGEPQPHAAALDLIDRLSSE